MIKILELNYKTVPSKSTETYIDLKLVFTVSIDTDYYSCFKYLSEGHDPKLSREDNWFTLHTYLEDCNSTRGLIADLEDLQKGIKPKSMFDIDCRLHRIVKCLINFWH